ncbi:hypothetical protein [Aquicoccus sp. SU-CL01552]|uniref:hypothetical protein n=1 Tax=Aquicoccus sp. SU-CL01552 TaxID=3127656 RepID=UPI0031043AFE
MSGAAAITALRDAKPWPEAILMPSAAGLGARLDGRTPADLRDSAQGLADACLSAARFLSADAVWISALAPDGGADFDADFLHDTATRAIAAARNGGLGVVVELRGPLARASAAGGDLDPALKKVKPEVIAEFEAIAKLRPDIIVLAEPVASAEQAESRALVRLYGALKRLAEHYDILKGMCPSLPGMTGPTAPDLAFAHGPASGSTGRAHAIAPNWNAAGPFAGSVAAAGEEARQNGVSLIVSGDTGLTGEHEPHLSRDAVQGMRESA